LHTARFAAEQNREVFAVPGSPLDPRSEGGNRLIRDGATLVTSARDVLEGLSHVDPRGQGEFSFDMEEPEHDAPVDLPRLEVDDSARARVLTALGAAPVGVDELIRHTGLEPRMVHVIVLELELAGRVERHRGQKISLIDAR
jgi:DNA processing protein